MTVDERIEALVTRHEALTERHEALTERHQALTMNVQLMQGAQAAMQAAQADIHYNHDEMQKELNMMLRSQVLMSESLKKLTHRMTELVETQRHTDQRMDAGRPDSHRRRSHRRPERRAEGFRGLKKWQSIREN